MRLHRFYVPPAIELTHDLRIEDERLLKQWSNVLRMTKGSELVLFDGHKFERLYKIDLLTKHSAQLHHVTDLSRNVPEKEVCLFWTLLKRDKNDFVLQKCTELGVNHFIPLLSDRCEKTGLLQNRHERWQKILIEAAEQCGRSNIPVLGQAMNVESVINKYQAKLKLFVADQSGKSINNLEPKLPDKTGVLIGPEGGWSDSERELFSQYGINRVRLSRFTLRAETASIIAAQQLTNS